MDAFIGEIRTFAFGYVPEGWLACSGQTLPIQGYQALYSLIGNTYGGTSPQTFCLPNLGAVTPIGTGTGQGLSPIYWGHQASGKDSQTLSQWPVHSHNFMTEFGSPKNAAAYFSNVPSNGSWPSRIYDETNPAAPVAKLTYNPATGSSTTQPTVTARLNASSLSNAGGSSSLPIENRQPFLVLQYCVCNNGLYPVNPN